MATIEKTVFISYRRKDSYTALAVYQHLTSKQYDVFLDYTSILSGDFEQIIVSNIKARAHFVLILTPTALDRCNEPGDWLRREIETAIDEKRNIIPLFFDDFSFSAPRVVEKLTGKLEALRRYNGLNIPSGYFNEAMEKLCERYLNVPLNAVIHPVSIEVRKVVEDAQVAANQALEQERENIEVLVKPAAQKPIQAGTLTKETNFVPPIEGAWGKYARKGLDNRLLLIGAGLLILLVLGVAFWSIIQYINPRETATPTQNPVEISTPIQDSGIQVSVYWDEDNDGRYTNVDTLLAAVLELHAGSSCSGRIIATSEMFLAHMFGDLEAGVYCVKVINESIDTGGRCALIPRFGRNTKVYQLGTKETIEDFDSGFPYICP